MAWRNRIVGSGEEDPNQLLANPRNWRIHPLSQQKGLKAVLDRVGIVQRVIVNHVTGFVLDGHMRVALAISEGQPSVPVDYVELDEDEEALVLATFDPLSKMAGADEEQLLAILNDATPIAEDSDYEVFEELEALLATIASEEGVDGFGGTEEGVEEEESDGDGTRRLQLVLQEYEYEWLMEKLEELKEVEDYGSTTEALLGVMAEYFEEEVPTSVRD